MALYTMSVFIEKGDEPSAHVSDSEKAGRVRWIKLLSDRTDPTIFLSGDREVALNYLDALSGCIEEMRKLIENEV